MHAGLIPNPWLPLAALAAVVLASCEKSSDPQRLAWWEAEQERLELTQQIALARYRLDHLPKDESGTLDTLRTGIADASRRHTGLIEHLTALRTEITDLEAQGAQYVVENRLAARNAALGTRHESFTDSSARTFRNAVVTSIDDAGVTLRHDDGISRLDYFKLTPSQREWLGLEQTTAAAALEREQTAAIAYDQWIDQGMITLRTKQQEERAAAANREQQDLTRQLMAMVSKASTLPAATPTPTSRRSSWSERWERTSYYRPRRTIYYYPVRTCYPQSTRPQSLRPDPIPGIRCFPATVTPARVIQAIPNPATTFPNTP
jgi:hypothetical protein